MTDTATQNGQQQPGQIELIDHAITFKVTGGPLDGLSFTTDLMELKLACEELERKHKTYEQGWLATADFLTELAAKLSKHGIAGCTPSLAYHVWQEVTMTYAKLKKNTQEPPNLPDSTESTPGPSAESSEPDSTPTCTNSEQESESSAAT